MINWAKLYNQGRVKAFGVPWNEKETKALLELKIPVEYVRAGILTVIDYTKVLEKEVVDGKPVERWVKSELIAKASALGVEFTPDVTEDALIDLIKKETKKIKQKEKQDEIVAGAIKSQATEEAIAKAKEAKRIAVEKAKLEKEEAKKLEGGGKNEK